MIGDLPADLVGSVQRCELIAASGTPAELTRAASAFYRSLTSGRWLLERPRYLHYSERARQWLAGATGRTVRRWTIWRRPSGRRSG